MGQWIEHETYYESLHPQLSQEWRDLRTCCLTASSASKWCLRCPFTKSLDDLADIICGLKTQEFTEIQLENMSIGTKGESTVRQWYSKHINKPVKEVGISVYKKNNIFRGSLDAYVNEDWCAEFKIPRQMYRPLLENIKASKQGYIIPDQKNIYNSHYDQMIMNINIHNMKYCDYVVTSADTGLVYIDRIYNNEKHWEMIYNKGVEFYQNYIIPRMNQHNLKRIDP